MKVRTFLFFSVCLLLIARQIAKTAVVHTLAGWSAGQSENNRSRFLENYGRCPISFELNRGQVDEEVKFLSRCSGYNMFLTPTGVVLTLGEVRVRRKWMTLHWSDLLKRETTPAAVLRMTFVGSDPKAEVIGKDELPGRSNYFIGNDPSKWCTDIPHYAKVEYRNIYPGVNLIFYGDQHQLEYDFVVAPGANPMDIQLAFEGGDKIEKDIRGDLLVHTAVGPVRLHRPTVYQQVAGNRHEISGGFVLKDKDQIGFEVGAYDVTRPLVIDPILRYSSYFGGKGVDRGHGIALDASGNIYVSGVTSSLDFPTRNPLPGIRSGSDAFVAKFNPSGSALIYSTYIGGRGTENQFGGTIAVDASGNAYITGDTDSTDFPTVNALQPKLGGSTDGFVTKLDSSGSTILYSTFLGGSDDDFAFRIAVDSSGNAFVVGATASTNFPTKNALQATYGGGERLGFGSDAFVAQVNPAGSDLIYSTYIGGAGDDVAFGLAVDGSGGVYIAGATTSGNFPTKNPFQSSFAGGGSDAFVAKLNPTGSAFEYSTYLGGSGSDAAIAIAVDGSGNTYVTGATTSSNFPLKNPLQSALGGGKVWGSDAFVCELNPAGSALVYSTYLGGSDGSAGLGDDIGMAITVDGTGNAYVAGSTSSANFPLVRPVQQAFGGPATRADAFVSKIKPMGSALIYSTYLGGSDEDLGLGIAVDAAANAYVTGGTHSMNFPTASPLQAANNGSTDVFIVKLEESVPACSLTCAASVPRAERTGKPVSFSASATASNCTDPLTFSWNFGDGTAGSTEPNPGHTYTSAGTFTWTMTASVQGATACVKTGIIVITSPSRRRP